jgi:AN1-type zinc finger protein 1
MAELPTIGRHCGWQACQQLDFLPLECKHCQLTFCKDHLPFSSHSCPKRPDRVLDASECHSVEGYGCKWQDCPKRELVAILCSQCSLQVCLDHRLANQHNCPSLKEQAEAAQKCVEKEEAFRKEAQLAKQQVKLFSF